MELRLFKKDGIDWTRFKIPKKEIKSIAAIAIKIVAKEPSKVSSRFIYYEMEGDFINGKR